MTTAVICRRVVGAASLTLAILFSGVAWGQQAKGPAAAAKAPAPPPGPQVTAIKLTHADAEEVRQLLSTIWPQLMAVHGVKGTTPLGSVNGARLAPYPPNHVLFVRATAAELEAVQDMIKVLDASPSQELPSTKGLTVVRLKRARAQDVMNILNGLSLQNQVIPLPKLNALVLPPGQDIEKEIRIVISNLDSEDKPASSKTAQAPTAQPKK
jgi:type II secretory pathway component GspD/PulD (secretin)